MGTCTSSQRSRSSLRPRESEHCKNGASKTCLHDAVKSADLHKLAKLLCRGIKPNIFDRRGLTPLHLACEIGDENLVTLLLVKGADVNYATQNTHGFSTPLIFAASNGNSECVHLLLGAGAAVNETDEWGNTALFKAASYNHVQCVRLLLQHGACPNIANRWGALPLQYAALQGYDECVKLLLEHKSDVRSRGEETAPAALQGASMRGYYKCVKLLVEGGTDIHMSNNNNGETILYHTIKHCQYATNGYSSNSNATISDRMACIQLLLQHGASVTRPCLELLCIDAFFSNLLANKDNLLLYKLLLRAYAPDPESRPFMELLFEDMARVHLWEIVQLMISVGFTPNKENIDGVADSLLSDHWQFLEKIRKTPRSLQDICRLNIRKNLPKNVIHSVRKLGLPKIIEDYLVIKTPGHYSYEYETFRSSSMLMMLLEVPIELFPFS